MRGGARYEVRGGDAKGEVIVIAIAIAVIPPRCLEERGRVNDVTLDEAVCVHERDSSVRSISNEAWRGGVAVRQVKLGHGEAARGLRPRLGLRGF